METNKATELRLKQDFLIHLAVDMAGYDESLQVVEGGPTISRLRPFIHPEWEYAIDFQISELAKMLRVGVPNFALLVPYFVPISVATKSSLPKTRKRK